MTHVIGLIVSIMQRADILDDCYIKGDAAHVQVNAKLFLCFLSHCKAQRHACKYLLPTQESSTLH